MTARKHTALPPRRARRFVTDLHRMADRALAAGARRVHMSRIVWDISGRCQRPFVSELYARPSGDEALRKIHNKRRDIVVGRGTMVPLTIELKTPCRDCDACRSSKVRLWTARAISETRVAARTWMGTMTLRPEAYVAALNWCRRKEHAQGVDFDALPERERLALIHAHVSKELTKMFKRIRQQAAGPVRYLAVLELHKSGVPHYHCLLHEVDAGNPVRHADLVGQWPLGFSKWKLVDSPEKGGYVAKYLSKSMLARVRASEHYGQGFQTVLTKALGERSGGVTNSPPKRKAQF